MLSLYFEYQDSWVGLHQTQKCNTDLHLSPLWLTLLQHLKSVWVCVNVSNRDQSVNDEIDQEGDKCKIDKCKHARTRVSTEYVWIEASFDLYARSCTHTRTLSHTCCPFELQPTRRVSWCLSQTGNGAGKEVCATNMRRKGVDRRRCGGVKMKRRAGGSVLSSDSKCYMFSCRFARSCICVRFCWIGFLSLT